MVNEYEMVKKLTEWEIRRYLDRIGYKGVYDVTKDVLDELIYRHQCTVPFETLDPHDLKKEVDLSPDALFEKIVLRHRGGYCLELNGMFYRLLYSLGFTVRPCQCRVLLGTEEFTHPVDHRGTLVELDGKTWFCDVGLGGPMPPAALDINRDTWQEMKGEYFLVKEDVTGWKAVVRRTGGSKDLYNEEGVTQRTEILFTPIQCYETDFLFLNHYMSTHPQALHVAHRILNLRTPQGYRAIKDDLFKEVRDSEVVTEVIRDNLNQILEEKFGIVEFV